MCRTFVVLCLLLSCAPAFALSNQLQGHPSPYLALHGDDPVEWQEWTPAALALGREQGKLIYMSIGYFSCHWCHVMQRESYRNPEIAGILNENFIPVKVDRELEPALDARLIEFAQATQGIAGWPLNVFLTPEGYPLYAVVYLPPTNFRTVLLRLRELWRQDGQKLAELAAREYAFSDGPGKPELEPARVRNLTESALEVAMTMADRNHGGFGETTKFPMVPQMDFLLDQYERGGDRELGEFLRLTLDQMMENGMYDHIGGGFFRYTTDPGWEEPHFEKMLYDNALLAVLYLRAAVVFDKPRYQEVGRATLDFMLHEMKGGDGALVASFSAVDDKGIEGGYYLWRKAELSVLLTDAEKRVVELAWDMEGPLAFQAGYLPKKGIDPEQIGARLNASKEEIVKLLESAKNKLFDARSQRVLPTDTKRLAGWNGLALFGFAEAAKITDNPVYRQAAGGVRDYLMDELWDGAALKRAVDGERELGRASLEDYAYVALGLWAWANLTRAEKDFDAVARIVEQAWIRFYDAGWRMAESSLIAAEPLRDLISDGAMPSPAAVIADLTIRLAARSGPVEHGNRVLAALNSGGEQLQSGGFWHTTHIRAMLAAIEGR